MLQKLWANAKHLPSSIPGALVGCAGLALSLTASPLLQQAAASSATVAKWVSGITGIATGLVLIFGVGPKQP